MCRLSCRAQACEATCETGDLDLAWRRREPWASATRPDATPPTRETPGLYMGHLAHTHIFLYYTPISSIKHTCILEIRLRLIFYDSLQKLHAASSKVGDAGRASRVGGWVMMVT